MHEIEPIPAPSPRPLERLDARTDPRISRSEIPRIEVARSEVALPEATGNETMPGAATRLDAGWIDTVDGGDHRSETARSDAARIDAAWASATRTDAERRELQLGAPTPFDRAISEVHAAPSSVDEGSLQPLQGVVRELATAIAPVVDARVENPREVWLAVQRGIRARVHPEQFETWFRRANVYHCDATTLRLAVQNTFTRDWIERYYRPVIEAAVVEACGSARKVEIAADPELVAPLPARGSEAAPEPIPVPQRAPPLSEPDRALHAATELGLNAKYTFDNFVVGPCNRFAHAAAVGSAEQPGKAYNPFFLHGSVGLGKTHLLQSFCWALLARNPKTRILFLSCETFVNHFIDALENGDLTKFRNKYRNVDVLVVDDIHLLANKERTQEEFFHTFNTLYQSGKQIVLSSDSPPKDIPTLQERLVSRFKWGLVTEIEPPCYETRMAILKRKSREKGREIPDEVARQVAERVESNIRELEGAVTKLLGYASLTGQPVTPELAREVLSDLFATRKGQPSMDEILAIVSEQFGVKLSELVSRKRTAAIAYPRQIAMYVARRITRHSLEEIGGFFGGRDHSTVLYAVDKIGTLVESDATCRGAVESVLTRLDAPAS